MFRSIRWRLVASYTLMTVLAVTLVGFLALFLIQRYLLNQEHAYLTMSATAVAQQFEPVLREQIPRPALEDLARTTAFLSDVQIRILDAKEQLLADSGAPSQLDGVTWLLPQADVRAAFLADEPVSPSVEAQRVEGDLAAAPHHPGFFVQILPDQANTSPVFGWRQRGNANRDEPLGSPPVILFRRAAGWRAAEVEAFSQSTAPPGSETWIEPITPMETVPYPAGATATQSWPSTRAIFAPLLAAPQRVVQAVGDGGEVIGYVELSSGPDLVAALSIIRRAFLLAGAGVSLVAVLVALWISRSLTAPLHDLIHVTEQMRGGALSARAAVRGRDEIGLLATQFNTMAAQIESSFAELAAERDALRRFVADASHELRTPITALKTFSELLLGPAGDVALTRAEFLQESQKQVYRLEWITSALLKLSRLDAGLADLKTEKIDLRELMIATFKPFAARAEVKGISLRLEITSESAPTLGNAAYLETALANLLDNALKFTPTGGVVQVSTAVHEGWAELVVQDNGLGISPADRPYIFDRFYRGLHTPALVREGYQAPHEDDPARLRNEEGSGLGLAIVQSIVKAHGGQVAMHSEVGVGSQFVVKLPLAT